MFDQDMLKAAMAAVDARIAMEKKGFVPMPQGDPAAAGGAPMDPAAAAGGGMPVDPATGMPMDPAAAGGAPMDPAAAAGGGMPMAPMPTPPDPGLGGMPMPGADGMITMPVSQFIELLNTLGMAGKKGGGSGGAKPAASGQGQGGDSATQLSEIHQALTNAGLIGAQAQALAPAQG